MTGRGDGENLSFICPDNSGLSLSEAILDRIMPDCAERVSGAFAGKVMADTGTTLTRADTDAWRIACDREQEQRWPPSPALLGPEEIKPHNLHMHSHVNPPKIEFLLRVGLQIAGRTQHLGRCLVAAAFGVSGPKIDYWLR